MLKINTSQDPKDYEHLIKSKCQGEDCTRPTRYETTKLTPVEHYTMYGNWCIGCNTRSMWRRKNRRNDINNIIKAIRSL